MKGILNYSKVKFLIGWNIFTSIYKQKISPSVLQHQRGRMTENQDEVILGGQVYYITLTAISQDGR